MAVKEHESVSACCGPEFKKGEGSIDLSTLIIHLFPEKGAAARFPVYKEVRAFLETGEKLGINFNFVGQTGLKIVDILSGRREINSRPQAGIYPFLYLDRFRKSDPAETHYHVLVESLRGPVLQLGVKSQEEIQRLRDHLLASFEARKKGHFWSRVKEKESLRVDGEKIHRRVFELPFSQFQIEQALGHSNPFMLNTNKESYVYVYWGENDGVQFFIYDIRTSTDFDNSRLWGYDQTKSAFSLQVTTSDHYEKPEQITANNAFNWQRLSLPVSSGNCDFVVKFSSDNKKHPSCDVPLKILPEDFARLKRNPLELVLAAATAVHLSAQRGGFLNHLFDQNTMALFKKEFARLSQKNGDGTSLFETGLVRLAENGEQIGPKIARIIFLLTNGAEIHPARFLRALRKIGLYQLIPAMAGWQAADFENCEETILAEDFLDEADRFKPAARPQFSTDNVLLFDNLDMMRLIKCDKRVKIAFDKAMAVVAKMLGIEVDINNKDHLFDVSLYIRSHPEILRWMYEQNDAGILNVYVACLEHWASGLQRLVNSLRVNGKLEKDGSSAIAAAVSFFEIFPFLRPVVRYNPQGLQKMGFEVNLKSLLETAFNNYREKGQEPFSCFLIEKKTGKIVARASNDISWDAADWTTPEKHAEATIFKEFAATRLHDVDWNNYFLVTSFEPCLHCAEVIPQDMAVVFPWLSPWGATLNKRNVRYQSIYYPETLPFLREVFKKFPPDIFEWMFGWKNLP